MFLRIVIFIIGLAVLVLCIFGIPIIVKGMVLEFPIVAPLEEPMLLGLYLTAVPFFYALFQALMLLKFIDRGTAFSRESAMALRHIKYSAVVMSGLYMLGMPVMFLIAEADDAPGLILFSFAAACSPLVIAVFAAVLQKLVGTAVEIKEEHELTV